MFTLTIILFRRLFGTVSDALSRLHTLILLITFHYLNRRPADSRPAFIHLRLISELGIIYTHISLQAENVFFLLRKTVFFFIFFLITALVIKM